MVKWMPHASCVCGTRLCLQCWDAEEEMDSTPTSASTSHHKAPAALPLRERACNKLLTHSAAGYMSTNEPTLSTPWTEAPTAKLLTLCFTKQRIFKLSWPLVHFLSFHLLLCWRRSTTEETFTQAQTWGSTFPRFCSIRNIPLGMILALKEHDTMQ